MVWEPVPNASRWRSLGRTLIRSPHVLSWVLCILALGFLLPRSARSHDHAALRPTGTEPVVHRWVTTSRMAAWNAGFLAPARRATRSGPDLQPAQQPGAWARIRYPLLVAGGVLLYTRDAALHDMVQRNRTDWTETLARMATPLGDGRYMIPGLALLYLTGRALDLPRARHIALQGVQALGLSAAAVLFLKYTGQRHRPRAGDGPYAWDGPSGSARHVSFPSGHTATAFALATVVAGAFKDTTWVVPVAYGMATLTAFARVHDNAHWVSDVFFGALIGHLAGRWVVGKHRRRSGWAVTPALSRNRPLLMVTYGF